ncbi:hypothetical protein OMP40_01110 [Cohnella rhizosphaerae]|uniref:Uncharacterized protein n=1 Tax=Cohnella rhizosphaerae TaxID=1457232 RepID=A0A9X4QR30_9BACL|nr:hypothetical protein [Cohnella rhizosphaerae]MDG0808165.1 hypothetical protein [Cohnella rhizosphaerae]
MAEIEVYGLSCNNRSNPMGIGDKAPRLGWKLRSERRGVVQEAYRIQVAEDASFEGGLAWDTERMAGGRSVAVPYEGGAAAFANAVLLPGEGMGQSGPGVRMERGSLFRDGALVRRGVGGCRVDLPYAARERRGT